MSPACFAAPEPAADDGLRQIPKPEMTPDEQAAVEQFQRDIERHRARQNRLDIERTVQVELYRCAAR